MIQVFLWKISTEEEKLISNLLSLMPDELKEEEVELVDLFHTPKPKISGDTLLAFGIRSFNIVSSETQRSITKLPNPKQLVNLPKNKKSRATAFQVIKSLTVTKSDKTKLSDTELLKLSKEHLNSLKKTLKQKKIDYWVGDLGNGTQIGIVLDSKTEVPGVDTVLTFEEIIAAKLAQELLGLTNLKLIPGEKK